MAWKEIVVIGRKVLVVLAAAHSVLFAGCTQTPNDREIVPDIIGFSISLGALKAEEVVQVVGAAAEMAGIPPQAGAKVGQTIAPNLMLLGAYEKGIDPALQVSITAPMPVTCINVKTIVTGDDSERQSSEISSALRMAVEQSFPDARIADEPCQTRRD